MKAETRKRNNPKKRDCAGAVFFSAIPYLNAFLSFRTGEGEKKKRKEKRSVTLSSACVGRIRLIPQAALNRGSGRKKREGGKGGKDPSVVQVNFPRGPDRKSSKKKGVRPPPAYLRPGPNFHIFSVGRGI